MDSRLSEWRRRASVSLRESTNGCCTLEAALSFSLARGAETGRFGAVAVGPGSATFGRSTSVFRSSTFRMRVRAGCPACE